MISRLIFTLLLAFGTMCGISAAYAGPGGFAAHKALYDIRLAGTKSGSQIINITGQMLYEWQPTCEAWIANHRFNLNYEYADSPAMRITSDFSTYEPFDGKSMDFSSQRKRDGQLIEELRGQATLDETGKGIATYTIPQGLDFKLSEGSMFPMMHTRKVLDAITAGRKIYHATVFDGSDQEGPSEINAVIGGVVAPADLVQPAKNPDATLMKSPAHNVRLAFFPLNSASEFADYEMDIVLHENGVISDMFIEYDDFSVTQKLVALEPMPDLCAGQAKKQEQKKQ